MKFWWSALRLLEPFQHPSRCFETVEFVAEFSLQIGLMECVSGRVSDSPFL